MTALGFQQAKGFPVFHQHVLHRPSRNLLASNDGRIVGNEQRNPRCMSTAGGQQFVDRTPAAVRPFYPLFKRYSTPQKTSYKSTVRGLVRRRADSNGGRIRANCSVVACGGWWPAA